MDNQEAGGILANLEADYRNLNPLVLTNDSIQLVNERIEALGMAISALHAQDLQPTCNQLAKDTNVPCKDTISRQAAIDALDGEIEVTGRTNAEAVKGYVRLVRDRLERLPSAQQESNCLGCKHAGMWEAEVEYGYPSQCTRCKRRANDNYEQ